MLRVLICAVICCVPALGHAASVCFKKTCVDVEVMRTAEELRRGLQGRESLNDGQGMLFVFEQEEIRRFWMKGMRFAIDIIWMDTKGRVVFIAPSCPPCIEDPCVVYGGSVKARYVLEVPAGFAKTHQLKVKDKLRLQGIH